MINKHQAGFTLIEVVLVLAIVTLILPISLQKYTIVSERQRLKTFVSELTDTLYFAQMTAITEDRYVDVDLNNDSHIVVVRLGLDYIKKLAVSEGIVFEGGTLGLTLRFSANGTLVGNAGTIFVNTEHFSEKFTFLIGQGRFYVQSS